MIKIVNKAFISNDELKMFNLNNSNIGAVVTFSGYVRDFDVTQTLKLTHMTIEHYPGMTEKKLIQIEESARIKWDLKNLLIIHRVGDINLNEKIVFIAVSSEHRDNAFDACRYIIDYLKTEAPFWKKEVSSNHSSWVQQKDSDLSKTR